MQGLKRLEVIQNLSRKNSKWIHTDLFRILRKQDIWIAAYKNIKANTVALTFEGLTGMEITRLQNLQSKILNESYKFGPVRHHSNDKIVQEVIRIVLEAIYEPIFDHRSFGFRKGLGIHDALQHVEIQFRFIDWGIKGNIKSFYPTADYKRLCEIISQRIDDPRFMRLIRKSLKSDTFVNPTSIYTNIYFNELDKWIIRKANLIFEKNAKIQNLKYRKIEYRINKLKKEAEGFNKAQKIKKLIQLRNQIPSLLDSGIELRYARYTNDWILGIRGPKHIAIETKNELESFLKCHLKQELYPDKTKITNIQAGKVFFLGYDIFLKRNIKIGKYKKKGRRRTRPILGFHMPVDRVIKIMKELGYITYDKNNKVRPISKSNYTTLEDAIIVNHFRTVWLGLLNFYCRSSNWSHLQYIHYLLHISCAMTLAHRHRSSTKKIMKKHEKRLKIMDCSNKITEFPYQMKWSEVKNSARILSNQVSKSYLEKSCFICETTEQIKISKPLN